MSSPQARKKQTQAKKAALPDYVKNPFAYQRFQSRCVMVGDVAVGGGHPIVLQSMTTADTRNTKAVVREAISMYKAGSQMVRITAPGPKDAENLAKIKHQLRKEGYDFPLVADIHFAPKAAMIAIEHVEKVRINPGNFVDSKKFKVREYDDESYAAELERLRKAFTPLVLRAKELRRSLRIGANHGSLSDRILNRYGDTPLGMVESAMEYLRVAIELDYYDIILSMKASNPQVMIQAYRLLIQKFYEEGMDFPLHLGVTEAGFGWDGRLKSAVGIGSLLLDGIGDTIRVSLTEDPEEELLPARQIARLTKAHAATKLSASTAPSFSPIYERKLTRAYFTCIQPASYQKLRTKEVKIQGLELGDKSQVKILLGLEDPKETKGDWIEKIPNWIEGGANALFIKKLYNTPKPTPFSTQMAFEAKGLPKKIKSIPLFPMHCLKVPAPKHPSFGKLDQPGPKAELHLENKELAKEVADFDKKLSELLCLEKNEKIEEKSQSEKALLLHLDFTEIGNKQKQKDFYTSLYIKQILSKTLHLLQGQNVALSLQYPEKTVALYRLLVALARAEELCLPPIVLYSAPANTDELLYRTSAELGSLLLDGIGDAVALAGNLDLELLLSTARDLLQATRLRLSKTEFISCPSCGRTLFDLQSTTARIQKRTGHLKGVKIAVMGCIVNGPGEMADADFGYVGAGPGKVHLYREKEIVKNNIPEEKAVDALIDLIREYGMWQEEGSQSKSV